MLGGALCAYVVYALIDQHSEPTVQSHSLDYRNPDANKAWVAIVYVIATCGSLVLSWHRVMRWFGILNFVGVVATLLVKSCAFTSVWCLYAAIISVMIYWQFNRKHIDIETPNSRLAAVA